MFNFLGRDPLLKLLQNGLFLLKFVHPLWKNYHEYFIVKMYFLNGSAWLTVLFEIHTPLCGISLVFHRVRTYSQESYTT